MSKSNILAARRDGRKGNFASSRNGLLSHFAGHTGQSERRWREAFGYERRPEKGPGGKPFIAREAPKSSSDS